MALLGPRPLEAVLLLVLLALPWLLALLRGAGESEALEWPRAPSPARPPSWDEK